MNGPPAERAAPGKNMPGAAGRDRFTEYAREKVATWPPLTESARDLISDALGGRR